MSKLVLIEKKDYVAHVRLNRPDKYNALSPEMFEAITKAGQSLAEDKSIRSVVLSGEGRGFCAGLDFQRFAEMQAKEKSEDKNVKADLFGGVSETIANRAQLVAYIWKQVPVPVIAALHGVSYGGGLQIALGADIRLASPDATFSVMEVKWGLVPDMSGTQTLRDLLRLDVAKELAFTGRIINAKDAAELGLITRVCDDPLKEAQELAEEIVGKSPHAVAACKHLFEEAWHGDSADGLKLEEKLQRSLIGSHNNVEAVMANFEKRPPKYQDRE
ncbi:MAG: crotonase/enoyl-CoA hydratase family protein [Deltaproteobacteria bacterium]|nr:crotonase/enoyl-CoA hydratase family protein [Deltaproteobacteria bacterium]MBW1984751.1 crotonase/enoyl-CoA hydratase family protein [Deltaproteobacteria bacterium]